MKVVIGRSLIIALFASRMSIYSRTSPEDFEITTKGLIQGVGPAVFSITSSFFNSSSFSFTLFHKLKGKVYIFLSHWFNIWINMEFYLKI